MKLLTNILIFVLACSTYAAEQVTLKYIHLPKKPLSAADRMRLATPAQQAWNKYEQYYNRLKSAAEVIELAYEKSGKSRAFSMAIDDVNKIAKSPVWKSIATTQPFRVKIGFENLEHDFNIVYKYEKTAYDFLTPRKAQYSSCVVNSTLVQAFEPDDAISITHREYKDAQKRISEEVMTFGSQEKQYSTKGTYDPKKFAEAKKARKSAMQFGIMELEAIKQRARENGEEWPNNYE